MFTYSLGVYIDLRHLVGVCWVGKLRGVVAARWRKPPTRARWVVHWTIAMKRRHAYRLQTNSYMLVYVVSHMLTRALVVMRVHHVGVGGERPWPWPRGRVIVATVLSRVGIM